MPIAAYTDETVDSFLQALLKDSDKEADKNEKVVAAHKTVATFASITKQKMWLKNGNEAYTDGREIVAPYSNSHFYQMVEHEISHILFQSDFRAKEKFVRLYAEQIASAVEGAGKKVTLPGRQKLADCLGMLANILEDHRVNSLWAMLYPGSYSILNKYSRKTLSATATKARAHDNILTYALLTAYDVPDVPAGKLDRLRPAIVAALKKVERKGPAATFVLSKWLVTQLISELIRELQGLPPPPDAGRASVATGLPSDADTTPRNKGADGGGSQTGEKWQPPSVNATTEDRIKALNSFIDMSASEGSPSAGEERVHKLLSDVRAKRFEQKSDIEASKALAKVAIDTNVSDEASLDLQLYRSEAQMQQVVAGIEEELQQSTRVSQDDWITRDVHATVRFKDVGIKDAPKPEIMDEDDLLAAQRMRSVFSRIENRRRTLLSDAGTEVDVQAYVANRANNVIGPIFKQEGSGRGFKLLILLDRSASMSGEPSVQVERAARMLRKALKVPNVSFNMWGFSSRESVVTIARIAPNVDVQDSIAMPVSGETPLHIAVRTAINWMRAGDERKHILVLTDGEPVFRNKDGKVNTRYMKEMVRKDCRNARRSGIDVTAVGIGSCVSRTDMAEMFGEKRYWTQILRSKDLAPQLVSIVSKAFTQHLKAG